MTEVRYLTKVPVGMLHQGLYVAELDRPWGEVPVTFQGFVIESDADLNILREHCDFVYVEEERSRDSAFENLQRALEPPGTEGNAAPGQTDISAAIGNVRHPRKEQFNERVRVAAAIRDEAVGFLEEIRRDARLGRALSSRQARRIVGEITRQVTTNASAAVWLTNISRRDEYTSAHSVNVCVLTLAFSMFLGIRGQQLESIALGALLHDVGKVNMPRGLLNKTSPLTANDWKTIHRHPEEGCELLSGSPGLPQEVFDIVRMHHERIDGSGFPEGLSGGQIPLHARIVGLVNLYDSLTTDRPYRAGRPADDVLQELYNESELTYGGKLVQEFIRCVGIFPVGSLVELDNGALGVVVGSAPETRLRPTVLLVQTPSGERYEKRLLVNLAADPEADGPEAKHIRRVVNPANYDIDVPAIVAFEFGLLM